MVARAKTKKLLPFGWYGGKFTHLKWLLPLLPHCKHYCEPFGGSGAVLINRRPSQIETYNDLDGELCNFFRVLREDTETLVRQIGLTPYSREEFAVACGIEPDLTALERARRFFVRVRQARLGLAKTTPGQWSYSQTISRRGISLPVSRWFGSIDMLPDIAERLAIVQIENRPAVDVIGRYDSSDTLFYCDPPYVLDTRSCKAYRYELTDEDHRELAGALNSVQGKVAFSNYDCPLLNELYPSPKWFRHTHTKSIHAGKRKKRTEVVWTNYKPVVADTFSVN